jgi:hypothetical protein
LVIDLPDLGFILAGMAKENPRHHPRSWAGGHAKGWVKSEVYIWGKVNEAVS